MHLGILVTCFVPLLHNRLSRQLGQLSTPPPTLFSLSAPLFFRHLVLYPFLFLSFFLRLSLSLYLRLALRRAFPLFSPMLPSVAFIPTPSLYFFFSFLTTSALSVACPFSSSLFPCVTYSSPELGVIGRNSRTSNYRNKIFHPRRRCIYALDVLYVFSIILYDSSSRLDIFLFDFYFYFFSIRDTKIKYV